MAAAGRVFKFGARAEARAGRGIHPVRNVFRDAAVESNVRDGVANPVPPDATFSYCV
jgi:hypothetical protein